MTEPQTITVRFDVTGWTADEMQALVAQVLAQGNDADDHPDVDGRVRGPFDAVAYLAPMNVGDV